MMKKPATIFIFGTFLFFLVFIGVSSLFLPKTSPVVSTKKTLVFSEAVFPTPTPTPTPACATLLFGGDMMFDRHIREKAQAQGSYDFILAELVPLLSSVDGVVANLEGPVTDFPSRSVGSAVGSTNNYFFTFEPKVLAMLAQYPFILNLGNNHIFNFGQDGLEQTYQYLEQNKLEHFGFVGQTTKKPSYLIKDIKGIKLGLVNYNQFIDGGLAQAREDLAELRPQVELLIVYAHWGNEYVQENQVIKDLAREFIDAGADLVVGAHPHVVQGIETYKGKKIYYSLGNFVFDQYFEEAVQNGLLVKAEICLESPERKLNLTFADFHIVLSKTGTTSLVE